MFKSSTNDSFVMKHEIKCDSLRANEVYAEKINGPTSTVDFTIIDSITGHIDNFTCVTGYIDNFTCITGHIDNFSCYTGEIDTIKSNKLYSVTGHIENFSCYTGEIDTIKSNNLYAVTGHIENFSCYTGEIDTIKCNNLYAVTGHIDNFTCDTGDFDTIKCNNLYAATGIYAKDITATGNISTSAQGSFGNITSTSFNLLNIFNSAFYYNKDTASLSFGYESSSGGNNNTTFGSFTLTTNTTGNHNTAFGHNALSLLKTGEYNTAVGSGALAAPGDAGERNTAVGWQSSADVKGNYNTSIGALSNKFDDNTPITGNYNTCIGYGAKLNTSAANGEFVLGDSHVNILRCQVQSISALSDKRDKTNITNLKSCLNFINELKPVTFNWDRREWYDTGVPDGSKKEEKIITGFIAQDLKEIQEKHNMEYLNLVYDSNPEKLEATPGNLLTPLIKAVQELTALVNTQQKEIEELKLNK